MIFILSSRPGLYFLFSSKKALLRAAVEWMLQYDIEVVTRVMTETDGPFHDRLAAAFDQGAGLYTGPLARDVMFVVEDNPELLGAMVEIVLHRFKELIIEAIAGTCNTRGYLQRSGRPSNVADAHQRIDRYEAPSGRATGVPRSDGDGYRTRRAPAGITTSDGDSCERVENSALLGGGDCQGADLDVVGLFDCECDGARDCLGVEAELLHALADL